MDNDMKKCSDCGEIVSLDFRYCPYCRESFEVECEADSSYKESRGYVFLIIKLAILISIVVVVASWVIEYEENALRIIKMSQAFEEEGSYDTAALGYKVVVEVFPLSYATIKAKARLNRIKNDVDRGIMNTKLKDLWIINPYQVLVFPLVASFVCGVLFLLTFLWRFYRNKNWGLSFM